MHNGIKEYLTDNPNINNENVLKKFKEESLREKVFDSFDKLDNVYQDIVDKGILKKLQNQIQLTNGTKFKNF